MIESSVIKPPWRRLIRIGTVAAFIAGFVFRRNLAAEATMFVGSAPTTADGWFMLLHNDSLLGVLFLNFFDIINYALVSLMFLALYVVLRKNFKTAALTAALMCFVGTLVYIVSDTAFKIASLSSQYAAATTEAQKSASLLAGQSVLAKGVPGAGYQGVGGLISLFLIALAGLIISVVMSKSKIFNKATTLIGIVAGTFDFAYLAGLRLLPAASFYVWSSLFIGGAGLLLMVWHLLIGLKLCQLTQKHQVNRSGKL
jgi:hypothetical protein